MESSVRLVVLTLARSLPVDQGTAGSQLIPRSSAVFAGVGVDVSVGVGIVW